MERRLRYCWRIGLGSGSQAHEVNSYRQLLSRSHATCLLQMKAELAQLNEEAGLEITKHRMDFRLRAT